MVQENQGLTKKEVKKRTKKYGKNIIEGDDGKTWYGVLANQGKNLMVWILLAASILSFFAGKTVTFYFILGIIFIIIVTGFFQEWKAEKAMEKLKDMQAHKAKIRRNGKLKEIRSENIVPSDIMLLERGDKVPADAEVLDHTKLEIDEATLTGESQAVKKSEGDTVYSGTTVVEGKATVKVTKTGMHTELGSIAEKVQEKEDTSPLQKRVDKLAHRLAIVAIVACSFIFLAGYIQGEAVNEVLIVALSLLVATVPEALPLTLTLTLSSGMKEMAKENVIVKKMLAVESLGSTTVICTDKTGTLTRNEMTVKQLYADGKVIDVHGSGYAPKGELTYNGEEIEKNETLQKIGEISTLCNNAELDTEKGEHVIIGDPTEGALVVLGEKLGYSKEILEEKYPRQQENMFNSKRKRMSTINKKGDSYESFVKGAPEIVLEHATHELINGEKHELTQERKQKILETNERFAENALRVLGLGYKENIQDIESEEEAEKDIVFVGLTGMIDPPRQGVKKAIRQCEDAGIQVKMVTGDNPVTAKAIAKNLELTDKERVLTGPELEEMSHKDLVEVVDEVDIYARTHPEHKYAIVEALKEKDEIVAMTGDGINDAPAVKKADVGVGMGLKGTDVTKEAADIILKDDHFNSIVKAVKGGRKIYDNIEKFTVYLLSRNITEVILIAIGIIFLGFEYLPLIALQILFINVIGEELPALSLGFDPATKGVMKRKPRDTNIRLLNKRNSFLVGTIAFFMALTAFILFMYKEPLINLEVARTVTFAVLVLMVIVHTFNFRSLHESILETNLLENKLMVGSVAIVTPLMIASIYWEPFANLFEHVPLTAADWALAGVGAFAALIFIEVMKKTANKLLTTDA